MNSPVWKFFKGEFVAKYTGDYRYKGWVVGRIKKRNGLQRYVVENEDGMLFIFSEAQLTKAHDEITEKRKIDKPGHSEPRLRRDKRHRCY